ncbi:MAG: peptidase T [Flavobacteriales bacterium]|jgi:tripeptide aminopeptidase|nr:peptidase T [Flavobacteriales bacterium]
MINKESLINRFVSYVQIDTESDPNSPTCPSTEKQKDLSRKLVEELKSFGLEDAEMDKHGYVYATLPSNSEKENIPSICFCAHVDTSPDASGKDVKPIVHRNYDGKDIILPDDQEIIISPSKHRELGKKEGQTVITASGKTLLGADDKAGVAEIMSAIQFYHENPDVKHGTIKILFTPDEEIGRGADLVDIKKLDADFGYTMDGSTLGHFEDETFSADGVTINIKGVVIHPGFAKGRLENALKIASEIVAALPKDKLSPETTEKREPFLHPVHIEGGSETASIQFIVRSFKTEELQEMEAQLADICKDVLKNYPNSDFEFIIKEQYRNMKEIVEKNPEISDYAIEAIERAGIDAVKGSIRGGTDGSRLSFMGLPCPNIFAGGHAFHSKEEWVCAEDMVKASETIVHILSIFEERA